MVYVLKIFVIGIVLAIVESTFLKAIDIAGLRPDLLVLAVVFISGRTNFGKSIAMAFLLGLIRDFYTAGAIGPSAFALTQPGIIGVNAFAFTVTAYILLSAEDLVMVENWTAQMFMAFAGTAIYGICILLLKPLLQYEIGQPMAVLKMIIGSSVYTAALAPGAFFFLTRPQALPYVRLKLQHISEHETIPEIKT